VKEQEIYFKSVTTYMRDKITWMEDAAKLMKGSKDPIDQEFLAGVETQKQELWKLIDGID